MTSEKFFEVYDILLNNTDIFNLSADNLNNQTVTIASSDDIKKYLLLKYASRKFIYRYENLDSAKIMFKSAYDLFITSRQHNINKMYQALFEYDYSPIENTDKYETETINTDRDTTHNNNITNSGTDGRSIEHSTISDVTDHDTTTNNKSGFNNATTFTPDTETISNNTISNTEKENTEDNNSFTHTTTDNGSNNEDTKTTRDLHTHGNIGVTTNTELINSELALRIKSLLAIILDEFINDFTVYY